MTDERELLGKLISRLRDDNLLRGMISDGTRHEMLTMIDDYACDVRMIARDEGFDAGHSVGGYDAEQA